MQYDEQSTRTAEAAGSSIQLMLLSAGAVALAAVVGDHAARARARGVESSPAAATDRAPPDAAPPAFRRGPAFAVLDPAARPFSTIPEPSPLEPHPPGPERRFASDGLSAPSAEGLAPGRYAFLEVGPRTDPGAPAEEPPAFPGPGDDLVVQALIPSRSPITIYAPGPLPGPALVGDFLIPLGGTGAGRSGLFVLQGGALVPVPGEPILVQLSGELSFDPLSSVTTRSFVTGADGWVSFTLHGRQASAAAKAASVTSVAPPEYVAPQTAFGTVVGAADGALAEVYPDAFDGETSTPHIGDPLRLQGRTQPPGLEAVFQWTVDLPGRSFFLVSYLGSQGTDNLGRALIGLTEEGTYTVTARVNSTDPGVTFQIPVSPHRFVMVDTASTVAESAGTAPIRVRLLGGRTIFAVAFAVGALSTGTATAGEDYVGFGLVQGTVPGGHASGVTLSFPIQLLDDVTPEPDETIAVRIAGTSARAVVGEPRDHVVTIQSDDRAAVRLVGAPRLREGGEVAPVASVELVLPAGAGPLPAPLTADLTLAPGTASAADLALETPRVVFPSGSANGARLEVRLGALDDALLEDLEEQATLRIAAVAPAFASVDTPSGVPVVVEETDRAQVAFAVPFSFASLTAVPQTFEVRALLTLSAPLTWAATQPVQVQVQATGDPGLNFTLDTPTLSFTGAQERRAQVTVRARPDGSRAVRLTLKPAPADPRAEVEDPATHVLGILSAADWPVPTALQECPSEQADALCTCVAGIFGRSVLLHSGEERLDRVDLVVPGRSPETSFVLRRRYRSRLTWDGPLGHGWDFDFDDRLHLQANGDLLRANGRSHVDTWARQADGSYRAPEGFFGALVPVEDGGWVLRAPDGFQRRYSAGGLLLAWEDRAGNALTFVRGPSGRLDRVLDTFGRAYDFSWEVVAGRERIVRLRDFAGREVVYGYDERGDLVAVRSPVVLGTSNGNDFPAGRTERYTYLSGAGHPELEHNLVAVTYPEEVARGGAPALQWTYGTDPADPLTFDRVLTETEGGVNHTGVPAGGTSRFEWLAAGEGAPAGAERRVRITERNGNVREVFFDHHDPIAVRRLTRGLRQGEPTFFETRYEYDEDGQLTRVVLPEGNEVRYAYQAAPRAARRNVVEVRRVADPDRGGGQDLVWRYRYEPLYQRLIEATEPRGTAAGYVPPLGAASAARYTTRWVLDYMEGSGPVPAAARFGIDLSGVARGLGDQNGDGRTDQSDGNVVRVQAPTVTLAPGSHEAALRGALEQPVVTELVWNEVGQLLRAVDPEGNAHGFEYYPAGDPDGDGVLVAGPGPVLPGDPTGYLASATTDDPVGSPRRRTAAPPVGLTTRWAYDPVGHVRAVTNPRGVRAELEVTALGEVVQVTRGADVSRALASGELLTGEAALRYRTRLAYDHDGRLVRLEVEDRDSTRAGVGEFVERTWEYDLLGDPLASTVEVDAVTRLTTTWRYDPNQNPVEVVFPAGNRATRAWDERDLLLSATRGAGSPGAATVRFEYDGNGNRARFLDAEDHDGDGQPEATTWVHDGFDRVVATVDALGNRLETAYDVASQVVQVVARGHPPADPAGLAVLYSDVRYRHDELGRVFRTDAALFLPAGLSPQRPVDLRDQDADGFVSARLEWDALSRATFVVEDDDEVTAQVWDGASRLIETRDAVGNRLLRELDRSGNPVRVTSVEVSPEGLVPAERFATRYVWDQLDRLVRATDDAGQTSRFAWDSQDELVARSDPEGPLVPDPLGLFPGAINGPGNTSTWVHDGLGRVLAEVRDLRLGGTGAGALDTTNPANPDGRITLGYVWDANSRLAAIVDDEGNRTTFGYDELDRRTSLTWADGARHQFVFDRDDHLRQVVDPNGSVITRRLDALGRLVEVSVARAPGVAGTTRQTYAWDGVSRLVRASDDNGRGGLGDEVCEWIHDSLGRVLEERQNGRAVSSRWSGDGKRREVVYPGGRTIARTFDAIDRIQTLSDASGPSGPLAASEWIGPGLRELRRRNGNGTTLSFLDPTGTRDEGWDVVQRLVRLRCLSPGGVPIVDREYGYGRAGQRVFERRHDDLGLTDRWSYDSAYRVVASAYDQEGLPGATPRELLSSSYQYDGVGNRVRRSEERAGAAALAGLLARERLDLGVGAVARGGAQVEDGPGSSLALGPEARIEGDAAARRATLLPRAQVAGRLSADRVELRPGAAVGALGPYAPPGESVPVVPAPQAGALDVTVPPNQALTLAPGSYRRIAVQPGARLTLRAGAYEAAALEVDPGAEVRCEGAVVVRVGAFALGARGRVELGPGAAGSIRVEVAGGEAVALGEEALLAGALIAPRAEVRVGERAEVRGRVLAGAVVLGPGAAAGEPGVGGGGGRRVESTDYAVNAVNAYTRVGGVARTHDDNGNLTDDGSRVLVWDAFNRLVGVARKSDGAPIAAYFYLPDGRRSRKVVYSQATPGVVEREVRFVWDGAQEVEEQNAAGVTLATFVWSPVYVDELVEYRREAAHPLGAGSFYAHQDARCDVVAVTNASGVVVEKRRYDDFGREEIRDAGGAVVPASPSGLEYGFQGRRRDSETGWLYFRARFYDPETGRFLSRDPVWDAANVGGWYSFAGNGPVSGRDPSGLQGAGGPGNPIDRIRAFAAWVMGKEEKAHQAAQGASDWAGKKVDQAADAAVGAVERRIDLVKKHGAAAPFVLIKENEEARIAGATDAAKGLVLGGAEKVAEANERFAMGDVRGGTESSLEAAEGYGVQAAALLGVGRGGQATKGFLETGLRAPDGTTQGFRLPRSAGGGDAGINSLYWRSHKNYPRKDCSIEALEMKELSELGPEEGKFWLIEGRRPGMLYIPEVGGTAEGLGKLPFPAGGPYNHHIIFEHPVYGVMDPYSPTRTPVPLGQYRGMMETLGPEGAAWRMKEVTEQQVRGLVPSGN